MKPKKRNAATRSQSQDNHWRHGPLGDLPRPNARRRIALIAFEGVDLLDVAGPLSAFASVNKFVEREYPELGPVYECEVFGKAVGPVITSTGLALVAGRAYGNIRGSIDTLIVPGGAREAVRRARQDQKLMAMIRALAPQARRLTSVCTGTFILAEAGLLDGHTVTTHWAACRRLAEEFPNITVDPDPIYVRDGSVYSSAGKTAGIDLAFAMIEEDLGRGWALSVSRHMVVHLQRPGGQSQFSIPLQAQIQDAESLKGLPMWIVDNLTEDLTVAALAKRIGMSQRNFTRVFRKELHTTPAKFVEVARLDAARRRIENSALPIKTLACDLGFTSAEQLRRAFQRQFGINPDSYRDHFGRSASLEKA